jgi:hypothetical protein
MSTPKALEYKKIWMRKYRIRKHQERLLASGRCPVCSILLDPQYEKYHNMYGGCSFMRHIHAFREESSK